MNRAAALAGAIKSAEELCTLEARRLDLMRQLRDALALEQFAGRPIFEHGRVVTRCVGSGARPDSSWKFHAELGNGESLVWPLFSVPVALWPRMAAKLAPADLRRLESKQEESTNANS